MVPSRSIWSEVQRLVGTVNEPGVFSQWLCHVDSTVNIASSIMIVIVLSLKPMNKDQVEMSVTV